MTFHDYSRETQWGRGICKDEGGRMNLKKQNLFSPVLSASSFLFRLALCFEVGESLFGRSHTLSIDYLIAFDKYYYQKH